MNNILNARVMAGAAIVGLVSAAGVYLYEQIYAEKRRAMLVKEVAKLDKQVSTMRTELEALRELQKESQQRREKHKKRLERRRAREATVAATAAAGGDAHDAPGDVGDNRSYLSDSEYFTDYQSIVGTDGEMDSEEFYDVHTDDSDDTLRDVPQHARVNGDVDSDQSDRLDSAGTSKKNST